MKTVQIAIENSEYAQSLRSLLVRDGTHRVYVVDRPDLRLDGIVVIDGNRGDDLSILDSEPERFVIIARKGSDFLSKIWDAGVRHVLFDSDSPNTAQLAILAAEMRLPANMEERRQRNGKQNQESIGLSMTAPPSSCGRSRFQRRMDHLRGF